MDIIRSEELKEKRLKKIERNLEDLWNTIKQINIHVHIIGESPKKRREGKRAEIIFEEIMAENFHKLMRDMNINIHEVQQTPSKMNSERPTPGHTIFNLSTTKGRILKSARKR